MPRSIQEGRFRARATPQHVGVLPAEIPLPTWQRNVVPAIQAEGLRWYVCMTVPQAERRAAESLRRERAALTSRGLRPLVAYVPCATDWVRRKRGPTNLPPREVQSPMIRSYVFVGASGGLKPGHLALMSERDHEYRNRHGLIAVLGRMTPPESDQDGHDEATCALPLPDLDIAVVARWAARERADAEATDYRAYLARQAEQDASEAARRPAITLVAGDTVTVETGTFATYGGDVVAVDPERSRALVEISVFGRAVPIELDFADVRKAA